MEELLHTIHGSRLYGLSHSNSDRDEYIVVRSARHAIEQKIKGDLDLTIITLNEFQNKIFEGSHQALEALFSPYAEIHPHFQRFFAQMRSGTDGARARYRRAAMHFAFDFKCEGDPLIPQESFKKRRHAMRLALNLNDLLKYQRFNPALSESEIAWINQEAELNETYTERALKNIREASLGML